MDIQMVMAMAPNIDNIVVFQGSGSSIVNAMASDKTYGIKQFSTSWGGGVDVTVQHAVQEMSSQGQSFFNASGDQGADMHEDFGGWGNLPGVTNVGGTALQMSGNGVSWASETGWVGSGGWIASGDLGNRWPVRRSPPISKVST